MTTIARRIAAGFVLAAAPALIALGAAGVSSAQTDPATNNGPTATHEAFPHQTNSPAPGTSVHHHHQKNHG